MNLEEYAAKHHVLLPAGVPIPNGMVCRTPEQASAAVGRIGPSVVKAQVPTGKRGKSGGIKMADNAEDGAAAARAILGMTIGGSRVERVLIEERARSKKSCMPPYWSMSVAAVRWCCSRPKAEWTSRKSPNESPMPFGGMSLMSGAASARGGGGHARGDCNSARRPAPSPMSCQDLPGYFARTDAELVEINPLAILRGGKVVALDCKFVLDDASTARQPDAGQGRLAGQDDGAGRTRRLARAASLSSSTAMSAFSPTAPV